MFAGKPNANARHPLLGVRSLSEPNLHKFIAI